MGQLLPLLPLILCFFAFTNAAVELQCKRVETNFCNVNGGSGLFKNQILDITFSGKIYDIEKIEISNIELSQLPNSLTKYRNLKELKCDQCHLNKLEDMERFGHIENLTLSGNEIGTIGAYDIRSRHLLRLILPYNQIQSLDKDAFRGAYRLRHLDLSNNQISTLPPSLFRSLEYLQVIDFSSNKIESIEEIFDGLVTVRELNLSNNQITEVKKETFEDTLQLKTIDLSNNNIRFIDPTAFRYQVNLCILDIKGNRHMSTYSFPNKFKDTSCHHDLKVEKDPFVASLE